MKNVKFPPDSTSTLLQNLAKIIVSATAKRSIKHQSAYKLKLVAFAFGQRSAFLNFAFHLYKQLLGSSLLSLQRISWGLTLVRIGFE